MIVDRKKDMVNRGGENVYCVEVENALATPRVFEVAVLGVPDAMMGEKVGAVVVPRPGTGLDVPRCSPALAASPTSRCRSTSPSAASRCPATPAARSSSRCCAKETDWGAQIR